MQAFKWSEKLNKSLPLRVICYGDSITWGFDAHSGRQVAAPYPATLSATLKRAFPNPDLHVLNRGHNGWTSETALFHVQTEVLDSKPDLCILMFGLNDAFQVIPADHLAANLQQLGRTILVESELIIMGLTPTSEAFDGILRPYEACIEAVAQELTCPYLCISERLLQSTSFATLAREEWIPDGAHFLGAGYEKIGKLVGQFLLGKNV
ncbi:MAG: SGNH/GDSL hydrolase family protein [Bacteroidota bacterium]